MGYFNPNEVDLCNSYYPEEASKCPFCGELECWDCYDEVGSEI